MWAALVSRLGFGLNQKDAAVWIARCFPDWRHKVSNSFLLLLHCWPQRNATLQLPIQIDSVVLLIALVRCLVSTTRTRTNTVTKECAFKADRALIIAVTVTFIKTLRKKRQENPEFWPVVVTCKYQINKKPKQTNTKQQNKAQILRVWLSYAALVLYVQDFRFDAHHWGFLQLGLVWVSGQEFRKGIRRNTSISFCNQGNRLYTPSCSRLGKEGQMRWKMVQLAIKGPFVCKFILLSHNTSWLLFPLHPLLLDLPSPPCPKSTPPSFPFRKKVGLSGVSTEHGIRRYSKTRHKPSYQGRMRQPGRRRRVPRTSKESETIPLLGVPQEQQAT